MLRRAAASFFVVFALVACKSLEPTNHPEETCQTSCASRAAKKCDEPACARGCRFILDRIIEREGDRVIACVARQPGGCGDPVWADCAARVGWLADGGPPAPPPPKEEW